MNLRFKLLGNPSERSMRHFTQNHTCEPHGGAEGKVRESVKDLFSQTDIASLTNNFNHI